MTAMTPNKPTDLTLSRRLAPQSEKLKAVGADVDKYEELMASLSHEQLLALFGLEAREATTAGGDESTSDDGGSAKTPSTKVFESIPGLTESQIEGLTELESFIKVAEQSSSSSLQ